MYIYICIYIYIYIDACNFCDLGMIKIQHLLNLSPFLRSVNLRSISAGFVVRRNVASIQPGSQNPPQVVTESFAVSTRKYIGFMIGTKGKRAKLHDDS